MDCPSCGADVVDTAKSCGSCGKSVPTADAAPQTSGATGWGGAVKTFACGDCKALLTSAGGPLVDCAFCGSKKLVESTAAAAGAPAAAPAGTAPPAMMSSQTMVRPDYLVPFKIPKDQSTGVFQKWVSSRWFAPGDLKTKANAGPIRGVFLPFWAFDVETSTWYNGEVGFNYTVKESVTERNAQGQTVQVMKDVTKTRWERAWGWHRSVYDDVLVLASGGIDRDTSVKLEPFELKEKQPYDFGGLSGWEVEQYSLDQGRAWTDFGRERVMPREKTACESEVKRKKKADSLRNLSLDTRFSRISARLNLLPIYVSAYQYNGKTYKFIVNGQTGKVVGDRPYSAGKISIFVACLLALLVGLVLIMPKGSGTTTPKDEKTADTWTTRETAKELPPGKMLKGYAFRLKREGVVFDKSDDGSWYKINVPWDKATVQMRHALGQDADIDIEVEDANKNTVDYEIVVDASENVWLHKAGIYYVRVYFYKGRVDLFQYELQVVEGHQPRLAAPVK